MALLTPAARAEPPWGGSTGGGLAGSGASGGTGGRAGSSSTGSGNSTSSGARPGEWYHVVGTRDQATRTQRVYVDGVLSRKSACPGVVFSATGPLRVVSGQWGAKAAATGSGSRTVTMGSTGERSVRARYWQATPSAPLTGNYAAEGRSSNVPGFCPRYE
jgi:hypothetical protein